MAKHTPSNSPRTRRMKLWLLRPAEGLPSTTSPWVPFYDKAFGFVVRAETEKEARRMANEEGGAEKVEASHDEDPWINPRLSTCVELTADGEPGVVILDFASA